MACNDNGKAAVNVVEGKAPFRCGVSAEKSNEARPGKNKQLHTECWFILCLFSSLLGPYGPSHHSGATAKRPLRETLVCIQIYHFSVGNQRNLRPFRNTKVGRLNRISVVRPDKQY